MVMMLAPVPTLYNPAPWPSRLPTMHYHVRGPQLASHQKPCRRPKCVSGTRGKRAAGPGQGKVWLPLKCAKLARSRACALSLQRVSLAPLAWFCGHLSSLCPFQGSQKYRVMRSVNDPYVLFVSLPCRDHLGKTGSKMSTYVL